jgi:hypothetical protein
MPTVLRFDGLRVVIYPNDHRPAHVHVIGNGHEAVYELGRPFGGAILQRTTASLVASWLQDVLMQNSRALCRAWEDFYGID